MDALNGITTKVFDVLLIPFELLGMEWAMILISGIFGVLALVVFKYISSQKGIKAAKDKIKGHMIAIRIYQDDLVVVGKSIVKVLLRNAQYVSLNFAPFVPLAIPFVLVAAQMVVRYGFEPLPVVSAEEAQSALANPKHMLRVEFAAGQEARADGLTIHYSEGLLATSKLVSLGSEGIARQHFAAVEPGLHQIEFRFPDGTSYIKEVAAGDEAPRMMQPERVSGMFSALLWPAEDTFPSESPIASVTFHYPESDLGWLPLSGPLGVLTAFVVASMLFAFAVIKPLGVQI